jgi:hypothetical protein
MCAIDDNGDVLNLRSFRWRIGTPMFVAYELRLALCAAAIG